MDWLRKGRQSPVIVSLCLSFSVAFAIVLVRAAGYLQPLELKVYDWQTRFNRGATHEPPPVVIIGVTESDIRELRWPLTDEKLAKVLSQLVEYKARAVGIDIYRDLEVPPGRDGLDHVFSANKNIIGVTKFRDVPPPPILVGTNQIGATDIVLDSDGIVRRGLIYLDDGKSADSIVYSLAVKLALFYLGKPALEFDELQRLTWGRARISAFEPNDGGPYMDIDAAGYQFLLDFKDARFGFPLYSVSDVLAGRIKREIIADKIVLIGMTAQSVPDIFHIPLPAPGESSNAIPGVLLHGSTVAQLLRLAEGKSQPIGATSHQVVALAIFTGALIGGIAGLRIRAFWCFCLLLIFLVFSALVLAQFALSAALWVPVVPPILSTLAAASLVTAYMSNQEKLQRALLMQIFSRHVSPEVAETVWNHREEFLDGGRPRPQELTVTVMFTDLVNFTAVSENKRPEALLAWLNEYMEQMSKQVIDRGGVINKYIGDSVMGIFGVPVPRKSESEIRQDAVNAVKCALQMGSALARLNEQWMAQKVPTIGMRVGIYTGRVVVGSLGSSERLEYTIIGDTVNTASRLEGFDKESFVPDYLKYPCRVLVGESTRNYLGDEFELVKVGEASLKGKETKITVYNVLGVRSEAAPGSKQLAPTAV